MTGFRLFVFAAALTLAATAWAAEKPAPPQTQKTAPARPVPGRAQAAPPQKTPVPQTEADRQYESLTRDLKAREEIAGRAHEVLRPETLILEADRDPADIVLRRTSALLDDLRVRHGDGNGRAALAGELAAFRHAVEKTDVADASARRALHERLCQLRRRIAFSNPLLDFGEILFIQRNGLGGQHMCDQYYGHTQRPGGGLYVLSHAFGPEPRVRDVLDGREVSNGRLKGARLTASGSFLSPALSYDAQAVAFAYVECAGPSGHEQHTDPARGHWPLGWSYHLFSANLDGTNLRMLTDGNWNEFSPCFMPSGRIAFITERRGGYLRCGRVCPTYTLFDMAPDGADIRCLSYHETNEWSPAVTHDGLILWTRWDYVDRHGCVTHMPWLTTPDGRDPRPVHGNYAPRSARADMEIDARPIPGSHRFMATAAPHHGHAFGSLVRIDPHVWDDDRMAPVRRVTPEVGFPESQGGGRTATYGQAWPLSEDYFLCVYRGLPAEPYALYLADTFGNRELIYRDAALHCLSPTPVRPQPVPPAVPELPRPARGDPDEATVGVLDVYDSLKAWPRDAKIAALRVYQIFPLSLPSAAVFGAHETGLRIPQGADSITLTRAAIGTVPVEADGSAHFIVPARKELYFQALDENGLAITSMRSGTHFLPGERALCQGCHEPKHRAPPALGRGTPLALRRAPSRLRPEGEGSNPVCFPRLVQPVLNRHCVACHARNAGKAPPLDGTVVKVGRADYFTSYKSLAQNYGFYSYPDYHRTTPGAFGARASKLFSLLQKGHHEVKLPPDDLRRLTLWLDSVSLFYGVYEPEGQKAQLRGENPRPTLE